MNQYKYEVGDIVKLKKAPSLWKPRVGNFCESEPIFVLNVWDAGIR